MKYYTKDSSLSFYLCSAAPNATQTDERWDQYIRKLLLQLVMWLISPLNTLMRNIWMKRRRLLAGPLQDMALDTKKKDVKCKIFSILWLPFYHSDRMLKWFCFMHKNAFQLSNHPTWKIVKAAPVHCWLDWFDRCCHANSSAVLGGVFLQQR